MILACGTFSLSAFPLDDVWHRIFGQDVTLWSPTHLMLITGASLSTLGGFALYREALEESEPGLVSPARAGWLMAPLAGAFLVGLNTYMAEFDFAVPQFRLDIHPIGLMLAAGLGLVTARLVIGPWGALSTAGFFILIRGALTLLVARSLGRPSPTSRSISPRPRWSSSPRSGSRGRDARSTPARRLSEPSRGSGSAPIGLAAEWGWSHLWFEHPWVSPMFPQAALLGLAIAVSAGMIGGFVGRALTVRGSRLPGAGYSALMAPALVAIGVVLYTLPISDGSGTTSASFRLTRTSAHRRTARLRGR